MEAAVFVRVGHIAVDIYWGGQMLGWPCGVSAALCGQHRSEGLFAQGLVFRVWGFVGKEQGFFRGRGELDIGSARVAYPGVGVRVWCRGQGAGLLSWARRIGHWKCEELQTQSVLFVYGAVDEELVFFRVRGHEVIGATTGCPPRSGFVSGFGG